MSKNFYMHTINGKPAIYVEGQQIVYINMYSRVTFGEVFVNSLADIRKQQARCREWRAQRGMSDEAGKYGYLRINSGKEVS